MFSECFNAILGKLITVEDITPLPDTICLSVSTKLSITLDVEVSEGMNWYELK